MILTLDISTSVIGWALTSGPPSDTLTGASKPCEFGALDLKNKTKYPTLFSKLLKVIEFLEKVKNENNISKIIIEKPNENFKKGQSSPHVICLLQNFNGMVSGQVFLMFQQEPEYIMASSARSKAGCEIEKGGDKKEKVFNWLCDNFEWFKNSIEYTPQGNPRPVFYDMSDAIILALSELKSGSKRATKNSENSSKKKNSKSSLDKKGKNVF